MAHISYLSLERENKTEEEKKSLCCNVTFEEDHKQGLA